MKDGTSKHNGKAGSAMNDIAEHLASVIPAAAMDS